MTLDSGNQKGPQATNDVNPDWTNWNAASMNDIGQSI